MGKDEINALLSVIHAPSISLMLMTTAIVFFVTCAVIGLLKLQWNGENLWYIIQTIYHRIYDH
ncbi:unnamed protein product [Schistosoma spindalis]|nr:unnamed protein product [Schistosoma spindale]